MKITLMKIKSRRKGRITELKVKDIFLVAEDNTQESLMYHFVNKFSEQYSWSDLIGNPFMVMQNYVHLE